MTEALEADPADDPITREHLHRDLREVHLLIDFISGRTDKSLDELDAINDPTNPAKHLTPIEVLTEISEIAYPPEGGKSDISKQAALLMAAKDELSRISHPARGMTIAFTRMVAMTSPLTWWCTPGTDGKGEKR